MMPATNEPSTEGQFLSPSEAWKSLITLLFGTFIAIEAAAFQGPALPSLSRHFDVPVSYASLILLTYYIGVTVFSPLMGRLSDQVGRKPMVMIGLFVFAASEFLAAVSPNFLFFLAARFLQGIGVACILSVVLASISFMFPRQKRGMPLGVLTFAMAFGAVSGAMIGGLLIDRFGWPSIYWVSGALALAGLLLVAFKLPVLPSTSQNRGFDVLGTVLLFLTISCLLSTSVVMANFGSSYAFAIFGLGVGSGFLLWFSARRTKNPIIDFVVLFQRSFALPALIYLLVLLCFGGCLFTVAFVITDRPGGNASQIGMVNMLVFAVSALASPLGGRLADRFDPRSVLLVLLTVMLIGLLLYSQINASTPLWVIAVITSILGFVTGSKTPAVMKIALYDIPAHKLGSSSGLLSMMRDLGSPAGSGFSLAIYGATMGSILVSSVLDRAAKNGLDVRQWGGALEQAVSSRGKTIDGSLAAEMARLSAPFPELYKSAIADAIGQAMPQVGLSLAALMTIAIFITFLLPKATSRKRANLDIARHAPEPTKTSVH